MEILVVKTSRIFYFWRMKLQNMKHLFLGIGFLLFQNISAQLFINFGRNHYYQAKVYLEDGSIKEGFLLDFADEKVFTIGPKKVIESFTTQENKSGFKNEFYYFRKTEKDKDEKIPITDIKKIEFKLIYKITNKERIDTYEKVNLARVNNDIEIQSKDEFTLLPRYFSNSKITIYAYSINPCDDLSKIQCRAGIQHEFYFRKQGEDFAIKPLDGNMFTYGKMEDKFYKSFEYFGKDCPEFLSYLNDLKIQSESQNPQNKVMVMSGKKMKEYFHTEEYDSYERDIKKMKKKLERDEFKIFEEERKEQFFDELRASFYEKVYNELIITFINSCE